MSVDIPRAAADIGASGRARRLSGAMARYTEPNLTQRRRGMSSSATARWTQHLEQFMSKRAGATVVEDKASRAAYRSKPEPAAKLIASAAQSISNEWSTKRRPRRHRHLLGPTLGGPELRAPRPDERGVAL